MQDTLLTGTGRKAELGGYPAAGKTGTSQDFRDGWFVGYTGRLVTGVWLGNDDSSPTKKMSGGGLPAEIWARFMKTAHRGVAVANLPGVSGGSFFQTLGFNPQPQPAAPTLAAAERAQHTNKRSIDAWLIDGLFGRR
jgi:penicillin-binding protein 1A